MNSTDSKHEFSPATLDAVDCLMNQLRREIAEAAMRGQLRRVATTSHLARRLQRDFARREVQRASAGPPAFKNAEPAPIRKGPSRLCVSIGSEAVRGATSAEVFANAIQLIGLHRVEGLSERLSGLPLVQSSPPRGYQCALPRGGQWVCTHASNRTKKETLLRIAHRLGIRDLSVDVRSDEAAVAPRLDATCS